MHQKANKFVGVLGECFTQEVGNLSVEPQKTRQCLWDTRRGEQKVRWLGRKCE